MSTFMRWLLQSFYLLFDEDFEGSFWDKEIWFEGTGIFDGCADVVIAYGVEWVDFLDGSSVYNLKNVINSSTTWNLFCDVFYWLTI